MYSKTIQTVFLCEDTEGFGQTFAELLSDYGYDVNVCGKDREALTDNTECIIIDECADERECTAYVKSMQSYSSYPLVVILSSMYCDRLRMGINSLQNALYLSKPVDAMTVAVTLKEFERLLAIDSGRARKMVPEHELDGMMCRLGFSKHLKGFEYIKECFYAALEQPELLGNVSKKLYPLAAERTGAAPSSVEKNIRGAISAAFDEGRNEALKEFVNKTSCPTNAAVIKALYNYFVGAK